MYILGNVCTICMYLVHSIIRTYALCRHYTHVCMYEISCKTAIMVSCIDDLYFYCHEGMQHFISNLCFCTCLYTCMHKRHPYIRTYWRHTLHKDTHTNTAPYMVYSGKAPSNTYTYAYSAIHKHISKLHTHADPYTRHAHTRIHIYVHWTYTYAHIYTNKCTGINIYTHTYTYTPCK